MNDDAMNDAIRAAGLTNPLIIFQALHNDRMLTIVGPALACPVCQKEHRPSPRGETWRDGEVFDFACGCGLRLEMMVMLVTLDESTWIGGPPGDPNNTDYSGVEK